MNMGLGTLMDCISVVCGGSCAGLLNNALSYAAVIKKPFVYSNKTRLKEQRFLDYDSNVRRRKRRKELERRHIKTLNLHYSNSEWQNA